MTVHDPSRRTMQNVETKALNPANAPTPKGAARVNDILATAHRIFINEGYVALSMRRLAADLGVRINAVQHYYPTKVLLLEAMLIHTLDRYEAKMRRALHPIEDALPPQRLRVTLEYFMRSTEDPETNAVVSELHALASRNDFAKGILGEVLRRARELVLPALRAFADGHDNETYDLRAALIVAQFHGLMVYLAANSPPKKGLSRLRKETIEACTRIAAP